jgi:hypothetical protein
VGFLVARVRAKSFQGSTMSNHIAGPATTLMALPTKHLVIGGQINELARRAISKFEHDPGLSSL